MILVIDNYDSFVFNLARYVERLGRTCTIHRNDMISLDEINAMSPEAIIISPGPCTPKEAGISVEAIKNFGSTTPILGVCLGHQAIGEAYGGKTSRGETPVHGKASIIEHDESPLFQNIPNPMEVGRYHSLIIDLPEQSPLIISAQTQDTGEIMAVRHETHPVFGVQFHPESVLTPQGLDLVKNFLHLADDWHALQQKE